MGSLHRKGKRILAFVLAVCMCVTGNGCFGWSLLNVQAQTEKALAAADRTGEGETVNPMPAGAIEIDAQKKQIILNGNAVIFRQNEEGRTELYLDCNRNGLAEESDTVIAAEYDETIKGSFAEYAVYGVLNKETSYNVDIVIEGGVLGAVFGVENGAARAVTITIKGTPSISAVAAVDNGYCGNRAALAIEDASHIKNTVLADKAIIGGAARISVSGMLSSQGGNIKTLCKDSSFYETLTADIASTDAVVRVLGEGCTAGKDVVVHAGGEKQGLIYGGYGADIKGSLSCFVSGSIERLFALYGGTIGGNVRIEAKDYCGDIYGNESGSVSGDMRLMLSECSARQNVYAAREGSVKGKIILEASHCSYDDVYGAYQLSEECKGVELYFEDTACSGNIYAAYGTKLTAADGQAIMLSLIRCSVSYVCAERDCGEIKGAITMRGSGLTGAGSNNTIYVTRGSATIIGNIVCRLSGEIGDFYAIKDTTRVTGSLNVTLIGDGSAVSASGAGSKTILDGSGCCVSGNVQVRLQQQSAYYLRGNYGGVIEGDFKLTITGSGYISELDVNTGCIKGDVETVLNRAAISYSLYFNLGEIQGDAKTAYTLSGEMQGNYIGNRGNIAGVYDVTVNNMSVASFYGNEANVGEAYYLTIYQGSFHTFSGTSVPVKMACIDRLGGSYNQGSGISASGSVNGYDNNRGNVTFYGSYQLDKERSFETVTAAPGSRLTIGEDGALRTKELTNSGVIINCGILSSEKYVEKGPLFYYAGELDLNGQSSVSQYSLIFYPISIETDLTAADRYISVSASTMEIDNQAVYFSPKGSLVTMHVTDEEHYYLEQLRVRSQSGKQLSCQKQSFVMPEEAVSCELICRERHSTNPEGQQNVFVDDITRNITIYHDDVLIRKLSNGNTAICDAKADTILYEGDLSAYNVRIQSDKEKVKLHRVKVEGGELFSLCGLQGAAGTVENVELTILEDACINRIDAIKDSTITGSLLFENRSSHSATVSPLSDSKAEQGYLAMQKEQVSVGGAYRFSKDIKVSSLVINADSDAVLPEGIVIDARNIDINGAFHIQGAVRADYVKVNHDLTVQAAGELTVKDTLTCRERIYLMGQMSAEHISNTSSSNAIIVMDGILHNTDGVYVYYPYILNWNEQQVNARYDNYNSNTIFYGDIAYGRRNSNIKIYVSAKTDYQIEDVRVNRLSQYEQKNGYITITMPDCKAELEIISSAVHEWGEWTVEQEADCITQGIEISTCKLCGETKERTVPALGHLYQEAWELEIPATTQRSGKAVRSCQREGCANPEQEQIIPAMSYRFKDAWCVYDGQAHVVMPEIDTPQTVTVSYSLNGGEYKPEYPELIEAGCYRVSCKIEAEGYETEIAEAKLTIYQNQTEGQEEGTPSIKPTTEERKPTTEEAKPTTEETKPTTEEVKPTTEETKPTTEEAKPTTEETKPTTEEIKPTTEEAKPTTEEAKPTTEEAKPTTEETKPTTEESKLTTEEAKPTTEEAKPTTEESKLATEEAKPTTEETKPTTEEAKSTTEETKPTTEETKPTTEETKPAAEEAVSTTQALSFSSGNLRYRILSLSERTVAVTGYKKAKAKLVIPVKVSYQGVNYQIVRIDKKAFYKNKKVKRITIRAKKIKAIGKLAFRKKNHITFYAPKGKKKAYKKLLKKYGNVK